MEPVAKIGPEMQRPPFTEAQAAYLEAAFKYPVPTLTDPERLIFMRAGAWKVAEHVRFIVESNKQE